VPGDRGSDARRPDPAAVAAALAVVPGVLSSSMTMDPAGVPVAVRIVLDDAADEVEVAALAHRILRLQFGVGLDPARIQLVEVPQGGPGGSDGGRPAQPLPRLRLVDDDPPQVLEIGSEVAPLLAGIDAEEGRYGTDVLESAVRHPAGAGPVSASEDAVVDLTPGSGRLEIGRLSVEPDGVSTVSVVTLLRGTQEHVGTASTASTPGAVHHGIAQATAYAVAHVLGEGARPEVEVVSVVPVGALEVVVVQVGWSTEAGYERLLGAAEVRGDVRRTVIRATLDAVNRRLALTLDS
jgi:hypothetical protein